MQQLLASCALIGATVAVVFTIYFKAWNPWIPITKVRTRLLDRLVKRTDAINNNSFYLETEAAECAEYARDFAYRAAALHSIGMSADAILYANLASAALFWVETFKNDSLSDSLDAAALTKQLNNGLRLVKDDSFDAAQWFFQTFKDENTHPNFKRVSALARKLVENQQATTEAWSAL